MINLHALAERLSAHGLGDKAFFDLNRDEALALCDAVLAAYTPEQEVLPYISTLYSEPVLVIPSNAPEELKPWKQQKQGAGHETLRRVLDLLSADDDMKRRYLGADFNC